MPDLRYLRTMISGMPVITAPVPDIVSGRLGVAGHEAFGDLRIEPHGMDTALTGELNRSGLHDVLTRIRDLALDLVGLTCLAPEPDTYRCL